MKRKYLPLIVLSFVVLISWGTINHFMETFIILFVLFLLALVVDLSWGQK